VNDQAGTDGPLSLGRQVGFTAKALRRLADATLGALGADLNTWIVLLHAQQPGGDLALSQRQLADGLQMSGPALVRHLDRLEADGLLRRRRDATDRRVTRITLTAKGRRLLGRLHTVMTEQDRQLRSCLTVAEAHTLERALGKLHAHAHRTLAERDDRDHRDARDDRRVRSGRVTTAIETETA
jgi:MarR family transcriptional regulator for hemolysin